MKLIRFFLGLLLLPVCVFATRVFFELMQILSDNAGSGIMPIPLVALCLGFLTWVIVYLFLPRPIRAYVLAHELSHALWALLMGARVSKLRIRSDGGSVTLSKSNILITLAPYFFPFYTVMTVLVYGVSSCFYDSSRWYPVWLWLIGFTWGFHCTFTISSLLQHQTDIDAYGHTLSYTLIYSLNVLEVCLWIVSVSSLTLEQFVSQIVADSVWTWERMLQSGQWVVGHVGYFFHVGQ